MRSEAYFLCEALTSCFLSKVLTETMIHEITRIRLVPAIFSGSFVERFPLVALRRPRQAPGEGAEQNCSRNRILNNLRLFACPYLLCALLVFAGQTPVHAAQRKRPARPAPKKTAQPANELTQLRDSYIKTTKEYKASLQKLLALYEASVRKAEQHLNQSKDLYKDGLLSKKQLDESDRALAVEQEKVSGVKHQIATADTQIAETLLEIEGDKQIAKLGRVRKGSLVQTTSFIRFNGASGFLLSNTGKIQSFFQQKFNRPLPIAVFGQGAIHDRWRLDHHNAMDISLSPDGPEGQALMEYLRNNGIPFSAFRGAIPGVATGPHIHIGMPSHRY